MHISSAHLGASSAWPSDKVPQHCPCTHSCKVMNMKEKMAFSLLHGPICLDLLHAAAEKRKARKKESKKEGRKMLVAR